MVFYWFLVINVLMFVFEIGFGWLLELMVLIVDLLDMLVDVIVYVIVLYVVGKLI